MKSSLRSLVLGSVTPLWLFPLGWSLAFSSHGWLSWAGQILIYSEVFLVLLLLPALAVLLFGPIGLLFRKHRRAVAGYMVGSAVFVLSFFGGLAWGRQIWRANIVRVAERGQPLVDTITAYTSERGCPPHSLEELVPDYIDRIPETGIGSRPEFSYVTGQPNGYDGNEWVLIVNPPCAAGFDTFMYFPRENYPREGYGGGIERIGAWGYVHE